MPAVASLLKRSFANGLRSHDVVLRGRENILKLQAVLADFCAHCGQDGRMDDLSYFFAKPGILQSEPVLFLMLKHAVERLEELRTEHLFGAALLYEYKVLGIPLEAMAVVDRAGGTLVGLPEDRARIAARMRDVLTRAGVHIAILSVEATGQAQPMQQMAREAWARKSHEWKIRHRRYAAYLQLAPTLDETLSTMHQKTRFNLRYYRRRAEKELGCYFLPEITLSLEDLIAINKRSSHPVSQSVLRWRLQSQSLLQHRVLVGVKDRDGDWLSVLAARRNGDRSEILWQMNRSGLAQHSIGTVMRSYFIENEIAHEIRRLFVEQGTPHLMKNSFVHRDLYDLVLVRRSLRRFLQYMVQKRLSADNPLTELIMDNTCEWRSGTPGQSQTPRRSERRNHLIAC